MNQELGFIKKKNAYFYAKNSSFGLFINISSCFNISFTFISNDDSLDWKDPTPQQISSRVISRVKPGSIVLFHNGAKNTPAALSTVLQTLQAQGYQIVPVSQLIYKSDYTIDNAGMQIPKSVALKTPSSALPPR